MIRQSYLTSAGSFRLRARLWAAVFIMVAGSLFPMASLANTKTAPSVSSFLQAKGVAKVTWFDTLVASLTHQKSITLPANLGPSLHGLLAWDVPTKDRAWIVGRIQTPQPKLVVLRTANGGLLWKISKVPPHLGTDLINTIIFVNPSHGWILATSTPALGLMRKNVYQTVDGGRHWTLVYTSADKKSSMLSDAQYPTGMVFRTEQEGWITLNSHGTPGVMLLDRTTDGGKTWVVQPLMIPAADRFEFFTAQPPTFYGPQRQDGRLLLHSLQDTLRYTTSNGGQTWELTSTWKLTSIP